MTDQVKQDDVPRTNAERARMVRMVTAAFRLCGSPPLRATEDAERFVPSVPVRWREETFHDLWYRCRDGVIEFSGSTKQWIDAGDRMAYAEMLLRLRDNPTLGDDE